MENQTIKALSLFGAALCAVALIFGITELTTVDISNRELPYGEIEPVILTYNPTLSVNSSPLIFVEDRETENAIHVKEEEIEDPILAPESLSLLFGKHTNCFRCEDYRVINDVTSDHYALQQECITDNYGIRAYETEQGKYYCVALAGHFGYNIGDSWLVELANGNAFNIMLSDYKHPIPKNKEEWAASETDYGDADYSYISPKDENGNYIKDSLCVVEFVVDIDTVPQATRLAGTLSQLSEFGGLNTYDGDIVRMVYLGRVWEGQYDINAKREAILAD